ncbi:glutamyl-prolyl-tRNA synthetase, isoform CRA_d [Rattus norvegicus]|uniref:Glutamyl-prolyl-tRNA synthetase, isoform CRA_d n=1 Tax=Rattus norvegicus TaxID=10116 RepID=A6JGR7_RAT|nr:glutamyl-prolyl-tRNA synthetase, isoform CRA_d [Rattus norvegicus]
MWNLVLHPWEPKAFAFLSTLCVSCSQEPCVSVARILPSSTPCLVGVTDG